MPQASSEGPSVPRAPVAYRCRYCGAPLLVGPDTVVAVCPYCGRPNWIRGRPSELLSAPAPRGPEEVEEAFRRLVEKDPDLRRVHPVLARAEAVFMPFYEARGVAESRYEAEGHLVVTITRSRDGETETETRTVPFHVEGLYRAGFETLVAARRAPGEEAVELLARHYQSTRPRLVGLDEAVAEWRRGFHTALAADRSLEEAERWVLDDTCDRVRSRVREVIRRRAEESYIGPGTVSSVVVEWERVPCRVSGLAVRGPLMLPLVKAYYVAEEKIYRAYFAGWDLAPLVREEPFTTGQRLAVTLLGGAASGALGAGAAAAAAYIGGTEGLVAGAVVAALGAAAGYFFSKAALRPVRRETGGPHSWLHSIDEALEEATGRAHGRY